MSVTQSSSDVLSSLSQFRSRVQSKVKVWVTCITQLIVTLYCHVLFVCFSFVQKQVIFLYFILFNCIFADTFLLFATESYP